MSKFLTEASFQTNIESLVKEKRLSHLDAILYYCEINELDPADISKVVSSNLKEKIRSDAISDGLMKQTATLPL